MTRAIATANGLAIESHLTLAQCESEMSAAIEDMRAAWKRFGAAIGHVHRLNLWRERYGSFDEYLDEYVYANWRIARATAWEWMKAAGVVLNIEAHADAYAVVIEPLTKRIHAAELSRLPDDEQAPALLEAREMAHANGKREATRYEFQRVVTARLHQPAPRSPAEDQHEREQRAFCDHIRLVFARIDKSRRAGLLAQLAADSTCTADEL